MKVVDKYNLTLAEERIILNRQICFTWHRKNTSGGKTIMELLST